MYIGCTLSTILVLGSLGYNPKGPKGPIIRSLGLG